MRLEQPVDDSYRSTSTGVAISMNGVSDDGLTGVFPVDSRKFDPEGVES